MTKRRFASFSAAFLLTSALSTFPAFGQAIAERLPANRMATNLAGATTAITTPDGFNPLEASDFELAQYGFPPRPDAGLRPQAFASWSRVFPSVASPISPLVVDVSIFKINAMKSYVKPIYYAVILFSIVLFGIFHDGAELLAEWRAARIADLYETIGAEFLDEPLRKHFGQCAFADSVDTFNRDE